MNNIGIYWKFNFKTKTISQKLDEKCPVYASLLIKFDKLVSLLIRQDVSVLKQCVKNSTFDTPVYFEFCQKKLNTTLTKLNWFKS